MTALPECVLLGFLQRAGLRLSERRGVLHAGPAALLTEALRESVAANRDELLACLQGRRPPFVQELVGLFDGSSVEECRHLAVDCDPEKMRVKGGRWKTGSP